MGDGKQPQSLHRLTQAIDEVIQDLATHKAYVGELKSQFVRLMAALESAEINEPEVLGPSKGTRSLWNDEKPKDIRATTAVDMTELFGGKLPKAATGSEPPPKR